MDWQGQKRAEMLMQIFLVASAVAAFAIGYFMRDFQLMMLIYAGGVVLTGLVTVPNWPFFNRHPLKWLDPSELEKHPKPQVSANTSFSSSKKKGSKNKEPGSQSTKERSVSVLFSPHRCSLPERREKS